MSLQSSLCGIYFEPTIRNWIINLYIFSKAERQIWRKWRHNSWVSKDVLNQLHNANYFSKKKGKALFMLKTGKEFGVIDRYNPDNFWSRIERL